MALISCPECGKKVSHVAESCPKCGFGVAKYFSLYAGIPPGSYIPPANYAAPLGQHSAPQPHGWQNDIQPPAKPARKSKLPSILTAVLSVVLILALLFTYYFSGNIDLSVPSFNFSLTSTKYYHISTFIDHDLRGFKSGIATVDYQTGFTEEYRLYEFNNATSAKKAFNLWRTPDSLAGIGRIRLYKATTYVHYSIAQRNAIQTISTVSLYCISGTFVMQINFSCVVNNLTFDDYSLYVDNLLDVLDAFGFDDDVYKAFAHPPHAFFAAQ